MYAEYEGKVQYSNIWYPWTVFQVEWETIPPPS